MNYTYNPMKSLEQSLQGFNLLEGSDLQASLNGINNFSGSTTTPTTPFTQPDFWSLDAFTGYMNKDTGQKVNGWAGTAFDTFKDVAGLGLALANYNRAARQQKFMENVTKTNLNNQAQTLNTTMEGMAKARTAMDSSAYVSPSEYMKKNAVSGWGG